MFEKEFLCSPNDLIVFILYCGDIFAGMLFSFRFTLEPITSYNAIITKEALHLNIKSACRRLLHWDTRVSAEVREDLIFPITERAVQKQLAIVCDYLGFEGISTHSFRKWYATEIYKANGYDIALVQRLLQHSSAAVTQRYIGIEPQRIEAAIQGHAQLL